MSRCPLAGVVVQGAGSSDAFVTAFLLQFSTDGSHWHGYREVAAGGQPKAKVLPALGWDCGFGGAPEGAGGATSRTCSCGGTQGPRTWMLMHMRAHPSARSACTPRLSPCSSQLFQGNRDAGTPAVRLLGRMVQARHVRILPQDFHNRIVLRAELLGCPPGTGGPGRPFTPLPWQPFPTHLYPLPKVPPAQLGVVTVPVTMTVPVVTVTMLVTPSQRPCGVGEFQCRNGGCVPGGPHGALCNGINDCGDLSDELPCGEPGGGVGALRGPVPHGATLDTPPACLAQGCPPR